MNLPSKADIVVVGGGPAGSTFALQAAEAGLKVVLLEKDRDIGMPVRCGEAVSDRGLREFYEPQERWIRSRIDRIKMVAPDLTEIEFNLKEHGYILDRRTFDYDLAAMAGNAGAQIYTKAYVNGLILENDAVKGVRGIYMNKPFQIKSRLVIGADGVESRVGRWAGLKTHLKLKDIESGVQMTVSGIDVNPNMFEFYLSEDWAPGGYLWVFPKGNHVANIGLGIIGTEARKGKVAIRYLEKFLEWKYPQASILTTVVGGIPVSKSMTEMVSDGLMLIGDAAHTVNPLTGGGIISGMSSGKIAAQTAIKVLTANKEPSKSELQNYEKKWMKVRGKKQNQYYRLKDMVYKLTNNDFNNIAASIATLPENKRSLKSVFTKAIAKKPSLLIDIARLFAHL